MSRTSWDIFLTDGTTGEAVKAQLFEGMEAHNIDQHENIWIPRLSSHNQNLTRLGVRDGWAEDAHWRWSKKVDHTAGQLGFKHFAIEVDGNTEGLMLLRLIANKSRIDTPKELVYVDYLSVAPHNRSSIMKPPKYRSIGTVLFSSAVQVSEAEGMNGRAGLHSLPAAAAWYLKLGLTDFGPDQTVQNLNYFELSSEKAKAFLDDMKD